jgi:protein-L-isoaspartate(D-aspartate) O-methyltransferase
VTHDTREMVTTQIESRGIINTHVVAAMMATDRKLFVPVQYHDSAYGDFPLPIGYNQTISQPYIVALMTELCELQRKETVLEIGSGSGYQSAVLSRLCSHVYSIERIPELAEMARKNLASTGCTNVTVFTGDGYKGLPEKAPFDVIMLTASPPEIPELLFQQLNDQGRLIGPEGDFIQQLIRIRKKNNHLEREAVCGVRFVPMIAS